MKYFQPSRAALLMFSCTALIVTCGGNVWAQSGSASASEEPTQGVYMSAAISSGYDTAIDSLPNVAGGVVLGEGSFSTMTQRHNFDLLLEQDTKILHSFEGGPGTEHFERTAVSFMGETSRRTKWSVMLENGFGSDAARATGSLTASSLNLEMPDQDAALFGTTSGTTLNDHVEVGVEHELSREKTVHFAGEAYVRHFFQTGETSQQYSLNSSLSQRLSPRLVAGAMAEAVQQTYNTSACVTGSLSPSVSLQANRTIVISASAGPILGSGGCASGYIYSALLLARSVRGGQLYLGSSRRVSDGFVSNSTWEELTYGGGLIGQPKRLQVRFDGGYAVYGVPAATSGSTNLQGYFISGELHRRLSKSSELALTARYFSSGANQTSFDRSLVLVTYTWSRQPHHAADRNLRGPSYER